MSLLDDVNRRKSLGNLNTGQAAQMAYTNLSSQDDFTPTKNEKMQNQSLNQNLPQNDSDRSFFQDLRRKDLQDASFHEGLMEKNKLTGFETKKSNDKVSSLTTGAKNTIES